MKVGDVVDVHPVPMKGKDGIMYNVFTFYASGRSWAARQYYIREDNSTKPIRVKLLPMKKEDGPAPVPRLYFVELLDSIDDKLKQFSKTPYVRKDKTFDVVKDVSCLDTFGKMYGVTKTIDAFWVSRNGTDQPFMDQFYPELVEIWERGSLHYMARIVIDTYTKDE